MDYPPAVVQKLVDDGFVGPFGSSDLLAHWNSLDRTGSPGGVSVTAETALQNFVEGDIAQSLLMPVSMTIEVNLGSPNVSTSMVDEVVSLLAEYDDTDTIVLIGHSLGGATVLDIANRSPVQIDLLALLDPVGYLSSPLAPAIPFLPLPIDLDGTIVNDRNEMPGWRSGLPNLTGNVRYLYNRWQTNVPFPIDFRSSGEIGGSGSADLSRDFGIASQAPGNGRSRYTPDPRGISGVAYLTGAWESALVIREDTGLGFSLPALNSRFGTSNAQQHFDFPQNSYIQADLIKIIDGLTPKPPKIEAFTAEGGSRKNVFFEGDTVTLNAENTTDPNPGDREQLSFRWAVTQSPSQPIEQPIDAGGRVTTFVPADNGEYKVSLTVTDPTSLSANEELTVTAINVAPTVLPIQAASQYVRGFPATVAANFIDPGTNDTHSANWMFGDGKFDNLSIQKGSRIAATEHIYEESGQYDITLKIGDDDGGESQTIGFRIQIVPVGLVPNPSDPSLRDLLVGGSTQTDSILVTHGPTPDSYVVTMNGTTYGPYEVTGDIRIAGQAGNDRIEIGSGDLSRLRRPIFVESGSGMGTIVLNDAGRVTATDYLVTPTSVTVTDRVSASRFAVASAAGFGGLTYTGSTHFLEVLGTDGVNTFDVQPSHNTRYLIDGNLPAAGSVIAAEGDFLKLDTKTTFPADPDGLDTSGRRLSMTARGEGTWEFSITHQAVDFRSIERFNHVDRVAVAADAGATSKPVVRVYDAETKAFLFEIPAAATYGDRYRDGVRVAIGDLDNDGIPDVVTAPGRMTAPVIKVFSGAPIPGTEGTEIAGLRLDAASTYGAKFSGGVQVAVGDVVGDALNDIVIAPGRGKAVVKVFESEFAVGATDVSNRKMAARSFDAFPDFRKFIGGATVATAKLDGTGKNRVVVGSGSGMQALVRVFDVQANAAAYQAIDSIAGIFPKGLGGVQVAAGDIDGDGFDDVVMGTGAAGGTWLRARKGGDLKTELLSFQTAAGRGSTVPIRFTVRDITGDGRAEIFAAFGSDARTGYRIVRHRNRSASPLDEVVVSSNAFSGGGLNLG